MRGKQSVATPDSPSIDDGEVLWLTMGDARLYARRWQGASRCSDLAPVVLLHDSLGCVALWRDFPARLAQATGRSVIAYDRLGFGRSTPHPGRLGTDFIQQESKTAFVVLLEQLKLDTFVVFGHSVGGAMAVEIAAAYPQRCLAIITEAAQVFMETRTLAGLKSAKEQFAEPAQQDRLRKYHGDKALWVLDAWIDTWLSPAFAEWCLDASLPAVRCPVLAMHGEADEYGSTAHPQRIQALAAGNVSVDILPQCGHVPHREQQQHVLTAVQVFLGKLS